MTRGASYRLRLSRQRRLRFPRIQVDENQHQFGYGANLSCDMKRMAKVMTSLTVEAGAALPHIYWLR